MRDEGWGWLQRWLIIPGMGRKGWYGGACAKRSLLDNARPRSFVSGSEHVITGAAKQKFAEIWVSVRAAGVGGNTAIGDCVPHQGQWAVNGPSFRRPESGSGWVLGPAQGLQL